MTSTKVENAVLAEIRELLPRLLFGTISTTTVRCGRKSCACHKDKEQRHGPYVRISYRQDGRTRGYYVPEALKQQALDGVAAWQRLQEIARHLAEANRVRLGLGQKPARRGRK